MSDSESEENLYWAERLQVYHENNKLLIFYAYHFNLSLLFQNILTLPYLRSYVNYFHVLIFFYVLSGDASRFSIYFQPKHVTSDYT